MKKVTLHNITSASRLSGMDSNGCEWIQFEADYLAEQEDGECAICGRALSDGWLCLDGADEVCDSHVYKCDKAKCPACGRFHL